VELGAKNKIKKKKRERSGKSFQSRTEETGREREKRQTHELKEVLDFTLSHMSMCGLLLLL